MSSPDRDRADVGSVRLGACGDHSIHDGESRDLPAEASAKVGDTIVWINKDIFVHTTDDAKWRLGRDDAAEKHRHPGSEEGRPDRLLLPLYPNMKATLEVAP
jgi:hypothetical protein